MSKPWNDDTDLARISADLDKELETIFDQVEAVLTSKGGGPKPEAGAAEAAAMAEALSAMETADYEGWPEPAPPGPAPPAAEDALAAEDDWVEPSLLGEPENIGLRPASPVGKPETAGAGGLARLEPEALRELSRLIEAAVEKGLSAALAKWRT